MTTARYQLVDPAVPLHYHLVSRCVRRSWLCGDDATTGINFNHRKQWLLDRMSLLARYFAVQIEAYAIMSNHFHLVVYYDPLAAGRWSDVEVAERWLSAFPPREHGQVSAALTASARQLLLRDPQRLAHCRRALGSLSTFMQQLKQPIALRANQEDGCAGHFFEQRFYSGALLDEEAVVAAMAYVDLNPVRARIAQTLEQCDFTSIQSRLRANRAADLEALLRPLMSGLPEPEPRAISLTQAQYVAILTGLLNDARSGTPSDQHPMCAKWQPLVHALSKRKRAYGSAQQIGDWTRRARLRGPPRPARR